MNNFFDMVLLEAIGLISNAVGIILNAALTAFPVMLMWNYLMPVVFGLPTLDSTQAFVLCALCLTLFKPILSPILKD